METEVKELSCGGCGEKRHNLYQTKEGNIIVECIECESQSIISMTKPKIEIDFYGDSTGRLTTY